MAEKIVYLQDNGIAAIIHPADCGLTTMQIALKDVPFGKPFKIIDDADLPADRDERGSWSVDEALLTDGTGADYGAGSANVVTGWAADGTPILNGGAA